MFTGWGKVRDPDKITGYFGELGIPAPGANAVLASYTGLVWRAARRRAREPARGVPALRPGKASVDTFVGKALHRGVERQALPS